MMRLFDDCKHILHIVIDPKDKEELFISFKVSEGGFNEELSMTLTEFTELYFYGSSLLV